MEILLRNAQRLHKVDSRKYKKQVRILLETLGRENSEFSLLLTRDKTIRQLNRDYRGKDSPTDVLSFPQDEEAVNDAGKQMLGDVVISVETAGRQAREHSLSFEEELILLTIHGLLHLLGYDHEQSRDDARIMKRETRRLFRTVYPKRRLTGVGGF